MNTVRQISWPRIFAEGGAIVVSILLAFWVDAWWDDRQEQIELQELLSAVLDDFQESIGWVENRRSFASARRESIVKLFELANDDADEYDEQTIDGLLRDVAWYLSDVPVVTSGLNTFLSSGKIGSLRSDALRRNLADWPSTLLWLETQISTDKEFAFDFWVPFIHKNGFNPQIARAHDRFPGDSEPDSTWKFPIAVRGKVNHSQLLANKEFLNILHTAWSIQSNVLNACDEAEKSLNESIGLLQKELDR